MNINTLEWRYSAPAITAKRRYSERTWMRCADYGSSPWKRRRSSTAECPPSLVFSNRAVGVASQRFATFRKREQLLSDGHTRAQRELIRR